MLLLSLTLTHVEIVGGMQVGNLAYRAACSGSMRSGQQAKGNLGLEEPDSDSTSLSRPTNHLTTPSDSTEMANSGPTFQENIH